MVRGAALDAESLQCFVVDDNFSDAMVRKFGGARERSSVDRGLLEHVLMPGVAYF